MRAITGTRSRRRGATRWLCWIARPHRLARDSPRRARLSGALHLGHARGGVPGWASRDAEVERRESDRRHGDEHAQPEDDDPTGRRRDERALRGVVIGIRLGVGSSEEPWRRERLAPNHGMDPRPGELEDRLVEHGRTVVPHDESRLRNPRQASCAVRSSREAPRPSARSCRCSPRASSDLPRRRRVALRAEVGRLPRPRLPRRRRAPHPEPRREAARTATSPSSTRRSRRSSPSAASLDGEIVIARGGRARLRGPAAAPSPRGVAREEARRRDAGVDRASGISSARATASLLRDAVPRAARASSSRSSPGATPPLHLTPATTDRARRRGLVPPLRRARGSTASWPSRPRASYEPNKRVMFKVKHERDCDCVVAGFRWHKDGDGHGRRLAPARPPRRRGRAPARRRLGELHRRRSAASSSTFLAPYREDALASHPWKQWAAGRRRGRADAQRMPGGEEPLEPGQGPLVGAAPPGARRRGRLRPHAGAPLPPHRAVSPLARRQDARATARTPSSRSSPPQELAAIFAVGADLSASQLALQPRVGARHSRVGIVVRVRRLLRRALVFRHVAQVHADARPGRRAAAHRVDEHVVHREVRRRRRGASPSSARAPRAPRPCPASWRRRGAASSCARLLRRRSPAPFARDGATRGASPSIFAVVRRPRRVAEARRLVARGEREQRLERARRRRRCRRAGSPIAAKRAGIVSTVKSAGSHAGTSSQRERRRDARVGERADRVRRAGRAVLGVLVVVEEDAVPLLLPPLRRRERRRAPLDLARERERGAAHLGERPARLDAHVDVHPARAARLRPAAKPELLEQRLHLQRDAAHVVPGDARARDRDRPAARRGARGPPSAPGAGGARCTRGSRSTRAPRRRRPRPPPRCAPTGTRASSCAARRARLRARASGRRPRPRRRRRSA